MSLRPPEATLADMLVAPLEIVPEKAAVIFEGDEITYRELDEMGNRVANGLIRLGVSKGDRVGVQLGNCPEFLFLFFGILRIGAILVPASVMYKGEEMRHILDDSGAKALFVASGASGWLSDNTKAVAALETIVEVGGGNLPGAESFDSFVAAGAGGRPPVRVEPDDIAMIQYTSGTTGSPKGAVVTHGNVMAAIDMVVNLPRYPLDEDSVTLLALPLFHAFGLDLSVGISFAFGLTMVLVERFDAERVFSLFEKRRVTLFWGAPPMYYAFVNTPGLERYDMSSLKNCMSGAAPLPVVIMERFTEMTGVEISEAYGLSETSPVLTFNAAAPANRIGSVGYAYPGIEIRILDLNDNEVALGGVGEIFARGANIFQGYWNREEETREAMRGGWFHTGDLGRVDEDGYYYITDRKKDTIIVSGYNVYPIEIENVLLRHPGILDCAVIGVPDDYQGEAVKAMLVARGGRDLTPDDVKSYLRERLAAYKCPKHVAFVKELPRSPSGKVLKRLLRKV